MRIRSIAEGVARNADTLKDATRIKNPRVLLGLLGPAGRGYLLARGKGNDSTDVRTGGYDAHFDWTYAHDQPELSKLYRAAKQGQWDSDTHLDWDTPVDPHDEACGLAPDGLFPLSEIPAYRKLDSRTRTRHRADMLAWMLSQFLHGEQGALFAACQVTEAVKWIDGKLYGSTQVVDEGRHVEVFERYLTTKLEKRYEINDNLYVLIDSIMSGSRWDLKFLGMQIMIEGLALGAFGTIRAATQEPLLRELLRLVITDEARHVHYGVVALGKFYTEEISEAERREREDWAYEMALLMRNRFLAHELYDEHYGHLMKRSEWNRYVLDSKMMQAFRHTMFRRIVPNLKRIGLLTDRIRPHYAALGLLDYEHGKAAPELTAEELLQA